MLHALQRGCLRGRIRRHAVPPRWALLVLATGRGDAALSVPARPVLRKIVARTAEVALLSVQRGTIAHVVREESMQSLRAGGWVGRRLADALHRLGAGSAVRFPRGGCRA